MSVITIPKSLREKLGEQGTEDLVKVINEADSASRKDAATKEDIANLKAEIEKTKSETLKWMFLFWAGQLLAMFAMLKAFLK
ncbi:LA_3696 family protein [Candidatus Magnetominusculus dajiuhuensis]|uniref:LA_3696 family protein n=1 Tax=Candidatus Magnetominusculus dajiuhuensis TaxID=3137712 RepID=UPI003B42A686